MLKVTFKNALGESIQMGPTFPYLIRSYSGFSDNTVTTQMTKGFNQHGNYYYGSLDGIRTLNLTVAFNYSTELEGKEKQKDILRIFNHRLGLGQITYEDDAGRYIIDAAVSVKPKIYKSSSDSITRVSDFDVVLTCPKPDWKSYESKQIKMVDFIGGMTFPITFPIKFAERGDGGRIVYEGSNPASVLLDFRVAEGGTSVEDPRIENHLGEYIEINKTITAGQKILIDTNPDAPSITFVDEDGNESDAWEDVLFGSTFFQLYTGIYDGTVGLNVFSFTAASGDPELYLTYRDHYSGV